jgi:hypothetical protein
VGVPEKIRASLVYGSPARASRRARRDGGALDAEVPALEVDVVQLVAVDEAAGGDVPDLGVVLPAVPQPAHRFDVVGGLVEEVARELFRLRAVQVLDAQGGERTASEVRGLVPACRHLYA